MSIKHKKVSSVPDNGNVALIQPSNWNEEHVTDPGSQGLLYTDATGNITSLVASAPGYLLRSKYPPASVSENEFIKPIEIRSEDYKFSVAANVGLTGGVLNTVNFGTLPLGITTEGANVHYVRIVDAVAGSEAVLITGLSGTSINFTPSLSHVAGNWHLESATGGIQEAFFSQGFNPTTILLEADQITLYAKLTLYGRVFNAIIVRGRGIVATRIKRDSSYSAGDLIHVRSDGVPSNGPVLLEEFTVFNGSDFNCPSGAGLKLEAGYYTKLRNIEIYDGFNLIHTVNAAANGVMELENIYATQRIPYVTTFDYGDAVISEHRRIIYSNCHFVSSVNGRFQTAGIVIKGGDAFNFVGGGVSGYYGIKIDPVGSPLLNFIYLSDLTIDGTNSHSIFVVPGAHSNSFSQLRITNCHIASANLTAGDINGCGIIIANSIESVIIEGCNIQGAMGNGIHLGNATSTPKCVVISGCTINNSAQGQPFSYGIYIEASGQGANPVTSMNLSITGNSIGNNISWIPVKQLVGIFLGGSAGVHKGYVIEGNNLIGNINTGIAKQPGTTLEDVVINNNNLPFSAKELVSATASTNVEALTVENNTFFVTGTTPITALAPFWAGRRIKLIRHEAGSVTIGGGNIFGTTTLNQFKMIELVYANFPAPGWNVQG